MDYETINTPCYVVEEEKLIKNLEILKRVIDETGCHILLAQKCFSMYATYPLIEQYLSGTTSSGLFEAKLAQEYMKGENHIYAAAYREEEMEEIFTICDHIVFNSFYQWIKYKEMAVTHGKECGIRINPQYSTQEGHAIYDPCAPFSRMGVTKENFREDLLQGISGLHFHTLCEQNSDDLVTTLHAVEEQFGEMLYRMKWLNFGGGHHITRNDYDLQTLIECIRRMQNKYDLEIYIEPGEAVALNAGYLVSTVLDIVENGMDIAILDTSAACHMPDVIEMPYRPNIEDAYDANDKAYTYRLGGPTCLAGDIIGDYSFETRLEVGSRLKFCDMAIYSMVKNNTFNGMKLPAIALKKGDSIEIVKEFGYQDFKMRLS
ncbi:MAG: carboxynorspermidine decarboxylase [Lachnotalea sp.]